MVRDLCCFIASVCAAVAQNVVISQVYGGGGNAGATLRNDFIELFNRGSQAADLTGWVVQYGSAAGELSQSTPLTGVIQPGRYYLVQQAAGTGGSADLPQADATGTIAMSATAGKVAISRGGTVVDLVGYGTANQFEGTGPAPSLSNTTAAVRRRGGCEDTNNNQTDFQTAPPAPRNSTIAAADCSATGPAAVSMRISEVQGPGMESPVAGRLVTVRGVVTARRSNGFWIESLPADDDGDDRTSEGLFIFTSTNPPDTVSLRNVVDVTGTVTEFRPSSSPESSPLTELTDATVTFVAANGSIRPPVRLVSCGERIAFISTTPNPPTPPDILRSFAGCDNWERFEGMTVTRFGVVVGPTLGSVNESTGTSSNSGVFYLASNGTRPVRDQSGAEAIGLVRVDTPTAIVNTGDSGTVEGPLDFAFGSYSIYATSANLVQSVRVAVPPPVPLNEEFTVASMNLQRLFDDKDDAGVADVVVQSAAYQQRITKIARVIKEKLWSPDIIGVQEAENIDVLRALANAAGDYDAHLVEGNDPGGIDVGLLVKRGRIQIVSVTQEGKSAVHGDNAITNDRPPLVGRIRISGTPVTVIVNHLRSLIGAGTPTVDRKRRAQAEYLRDLIARLASEGNENIVSIGDYNNFQFDPLMTTIETAAGGLRNLTNTLPPTDSYTYIQDGVAQTLDHMLVTNAAFQRLTRYEVVRLNADYPEFYRNDINRLERYSDHDVPLAYFSVTGGERFTAAGVTNAATALSGPVAPGEIVTIKGQRLGPAAGVSFSGLPAPTMLAGTRVLFDGVEARLIYAKNDQVTAIVPPNVAGKPTVEVRVEYLRTAPAIAILPVTASSPGTFGVLNQDFSVNSVNRPAGRGSVVMIYATGLGTNLPVHVSIGGKDTPVLYAGPAPGLVEGVAQVNVRLPEDVASGPVPLFVWAGGRASAAGVMIAVR